MGLQGRNIGRIVGDRQAAPGSQRVEDLYRRLTVEDAARAHLLALDQAPAVGFDVLVISAPTPFIRADAAELKRDAAAVVRRLYPDAAALFAARGWELPATIGRVYDAARAERVIGFRAETDFAAVLDALRTGRGLPIAHDPAYVSPLEAHRAEFPRPGAGGA
jgi:nucleoside-diphosphate-sugar epimerase